MCPHYVEVQGDVEHAGHADGITDTTRPQYDCKAVRQASSPQCVHQGRLRMVVAVRSAMKWSIYDEISGGGRATTSGIGDGCLWDMGMWGGMGSQVIPVELGETGSYRGVEHNTQRDVVDSCGSSSLGPTVKRTHSKSQV